MHPLDWFVLVVYIVWIVVDGLRRSKGTDKVEGYFLANRSLPWWAVGLSVMATQMSAVTLVGTTGQAYSTGLRFIQFYFGLPVASTPTSTTCFRRSSRPRCRLDWWGLMIAAIFAAAMSASAGELNALSTATIIDFYRRFFVTDATDRHYLRVSKLATIVWGLFASVVAMYAANQGSLIEVVNRYGSFFYGSLLGVFILAILTKRASAAGAFWA